MNILLWILAGLFAAAMLGAGLVKLTTDKDALVAKGMGWAEDFSPGAIKGIAALELLGGVGVILPGALDVAPVLVPIAAAGLALVMAGAVATHVRRGEKAELVPPLVLGVIAVVVAVGRFANPL